MALFRQRADWDRTASFLSALYNLNRDPSRSRAMSPADFNPYRMREAGRAAWRRLNAAVMPTQGLQHRRATPAKKLANMEARVFL